MKRAPLAGLVAALVLAAGTARARSEATGAVIGVPPGTTITFGRQEASGWTSVDMAAEPTGATVRQPFPAQKKRVTIADGRGVTMDIPAWTAEANVLFLRLPPGHYGVVRMVSMDPLGARRTVSAPITASGTGGTGARYGYALIEFDVLPGRVTDAGALARQAVFAIPEDVVRQAASRSGLPVVRKAMVITH